MSNEQIDAQRRVDDLSVEINRLYGEISDKEAERAKWDRIANPDDYGNASDHK